MKLKRIITTILTFIIILSITLLTISYSLKGILVNGVIKETVKYTITISSFKERNDMPTVTTDNEKVNKILQSKEVQELMNKYLNKIINNLSRDDEIDEFEIEKDIINYLKDNKKEIEKITGKEVTDDQIEKTIELYEDKHISHNIEQAIKDARNNMTTKEKTILKGYSFLISNIFRGILFGIIILNLILISIINKSVTILIEKFASSLLISGVFTTIIGIVSGIIVRRKTGFETISTMDLIIPSIIIAVIGLAIVIVYRVIEYKRGEQNELPEFSEEQQ